MTHLFGWQELAIDLCCPGVKTSKNHNVHVMVSDFVERDLCGTTRGKAVGTGTDCRTSNRLELELICQVERLAVAGSQQNVLVAISAPPDRTHSVDDMSCREIVALGRLRLAGLAPA